ncbi:MAG: hypothetical protein P8H59_10845 [Flavobacteriales bacterium]|nr:hypothetical protein [Flavobacteriales bacterium]MDG1781439.1 hypothetical protein [Flavobacteriales bacterium]MDG2247362.1 hypothetical protein [Flavobacteriales bacterium]
MLDFCKKILTKVSFDRMLFTKELSKAIKRLNKEELVNLRTWCNQRFGNIYGDVINESFTLALA